MPFNGVALAYTAAGGLILYSGIKGATLAATATGVLTGNLSLTGTETVSFSAPASATAGTGTTPTAPGNVTSGTVTQNGTTIYQYLRSNGYSPIQAAGAIASIYGESTWNPESEGTGGRGLIGWTPESTLPDSAFTGNPSADMAAQLPLILQFVSANGDSGAVALMNGASTVHDAAEIWGQKVERYGIDDVHTAGVNAAVAIAKQVDNVNLKAA